MSSETPFPKLAHAFFKWYCRPERYEELHGDLEELFNERAETSPVKARLFYVLNVIRCCQPYAWKKPSGYSSSPFTMYKNYYKTSFRILMKNPLSSFINIVGLTIAIGICVFVYGMFHWFQSRDQFHENKNEVYLVTFFADRDGSLQENGMTPAPLGEMLKQDFTEVAKMCRIQDNNVVLKHKDNVFHEKVRFVDPEFLEMFTFPLKWGTATSLSDLNSIILSEDMSIKYFGNEDPIGKDFLMIFGEERSKPFKVTGVAAHFPKTADIRFDFLINFENLKIAQPSHDGSDWKKFITATLIQVPDPSHLRFLEKGMEKYKALQNKVEQEWAISSFALEPLASLYKKSGSITNDIASNSYKSYVTGITFIGILAAFTLALACLNYINISIASAAKRLKEIGVRKAIGATKVKVIMQFLSENVLLTFFALVLGLLFGAYVVIPWMERMNDFSMDFSFAHPDLWIFLPAILLFTAFVSGIYPAFYISKFEVTRIFNGSVALGKQNPMSKIFLGFQLILACILIANGIMFTQNSGYMAKRSWGYDQSGVLYVKVEDRSGFERMEAIMARNPNVLSIAGSGNHLGKNHDMAVIRMPDRRYEVQRMAVAANYFQTMKLKLKEGRFFNHDSQADRQAVVVNELMVKNLAWTNPIGQQFEIDSARYEVVGVVEDFHSYNFYKKLQPMILTLADKEDYRFLSMRVQPGMEYETQKALQTNWAALFPEIPFQGGFQEDIWFGYFEEIEFHGTFWRVVSFIAVLLASLGLYGLVTLNVSGRVREFSIRKVLGANMKNIAINILNQYGVLYAVAMVIGAPVSYLSLGLLFDSVYHYHVPVNYFAVVIGIAILTVVLLAVIFTQVRKVQTASPVQGLKIE